MEKKKKNYTFTIINWARKLSDDELLSEYHKALDDCLHGSMTDEMYERGYDMLDIREQELLERLQVKKLDVLEKMCCDRGLALLPDGVEVLL